MLVEICSLDNGSGVTTNLDVFLSYNEKQKLFEPLPFCRIETDDFFDLLTDKEIEDATADLARIHFRVSKSKLMERANKIY